MTAVAATTRPLVTTRGLLAALAAAGPFYVASSWVQAATRPGFDVRRHAASMLSNGDLGWVQIGTFLLAGAAIVAGAVGMRRAGAGVWAPRLIGVFGLSMIAAGVFPADPGLGFPVGTPQDQMMISSTGIAHLAAGSTGFLALVAGCLVLARGYRADGRAGRAVFAGGTGIVFLASFVGLASGSGSTVPAITLSFWFAVALAFGWLTATALDLRSTV